VTATTLYDIAPMTKVVALTTAFTLLVDDGKLELDAPAALCRPSGTRQTK
jgi:CubicO group peptidase (beta-lactamase class C family)